MAMSTETDHVCHVEHINTAQIFLELPQHPLIFIVLALSVTLSIPPMNTRQKNKSAHPGIPDMTASQLALAGLPHTTNKRRSSNKKPTKDQQITALQDELRAIRELISSVRIPSYSTPNLLYLRLPIFQTSSNKNPVPGNRTQPLLDVGGDTDPATDIEEDQPAAIGTKRKASRPTSSATTCVLSRAVCIVSILTILLLLG